MTDIFLSYSSRDRELVRTARDRLADQGFDVFWDQQVPTGTDWDTWIRQHLSKAKCVVVFWSGNAVASDNVRHEAEVAKRQGKLVPAMLEPLAVEQLPMGQYSQQIANLSGWTGDESASEWRKLKTEVEGKLTPLWVQRTLHEMEAELVAERARREAAERRDKILRDQISKEAQSHQQLRNELDVAQDEIKIVSARLEETSRAKSEMDGRASRSVQRVRELENELHVAGQTLRIGRLDHMLDRAVDEAIRDLLLHELTRQKILDQISNQPISVTRRERAITLAYHASIELMACEVAKLQIRQAFGSQVGRQTFKSPVVRNAFRSSVAR